MGGFWEGLGALWTLQGLFSVVSGLCWALLVLPGIFLLFLAFPGLSQPFLAFAGLCWVLTRVIIAGGERSERAKRASEALWCFLWVSLAYPCFCWRALAFSCFLLLRFFACCLAFSFEWYLGIPSLMLYSVFGCSLPCFVLSRFTLCQHFLKKIALPVHLLRQVFFSMFFSFFFASFFDFDFEPIFLRFWRGWEGFWSPKWLPKSIFGVIFSMFFWYLHFVAFCAEFLLFF